MTVAIATGRPSGCLKTVLRYVRQQRRAARSLTTSTFAYRPRPPAPPSQNMASGRHVLPEIIVPRPAPHIKHTCAEPNKLFTTNEIALLDPNGTRTRLISRTNRDGVKVGDVLLVRFRTGDPFAGVVMNVRHRGVDSGILMRNHLTRVGTEMWVKVYSPTVAGMEIVQKSQRRMRRARAYYFRKPKHDRGSLANLVDAYVRRTRALGKGGAGSEGRTKKK